MRPRSGRRGPDGAGLRRQRGRHPFRCRLPTMFAPFGSTSQFAPRSCCVLSRFVLWATRLHPHRGRAVADRFRGHPSWPPAPALRGRARGGTGCPTAVDVLQPKASRGLFTAGDSVDFSFPFSTVNFDAFSGGLPTLYTGAAAVRSFCCTRAVNAEPSPLSPS